MSMEPTSSQHSSDWFSDDDPAFLEALQNTVLPGDAPPLPEPDLVEDEDEEMPFPGSTQPGLKRKRDPETENVDEEAVYGAAHFGNFGEYMNRKRAKLQIQNSEIDVDARKIFEGLAIYINGYTQPSLQVLRALIVKHGGAFQPYLDKKTLVTHVITCSLTPAKLREFQHMKVVRPEWLVKSAEQDILLNWEDFKYEQQEHSESTQGILRPIERNLLNLPTSSSSSDPIINPIYTTDPATLKEATHVPHYAAHKSNPNAERVMANPEWRAAHTSVASDFIEGYYKNSRLHHLSTWKTELRLLVQQAQENAERGLGAGEGKVKGDEESGSGAGVSMRNAEFIMKSPTKDAGKGKARAVEDERVIMHCDFDCFFVSAGLTKRPELKGKPIVVCHSQGEVGGASSTSEIASSSYEARSFGIKNGMSLQQARKMCPEIITIPYEFELYKEFSLKFYTILMSYADDLQAVSVDEALIDVSNTIRRLKEKMTNISDPAKDFADTIRTHIRKATGCEVSIGIANNILLARLATRRAKPSGSYHLHPADSFQYIATLDIGDLHGFGWSARQKAQEKLGSTSLRELGKKSRSQLSDALGKGSGETLWNAIRGIDFKPLESDKPRKSVSCEINYGIRFENDQQAEKFVYQMGVEVMKRLNEIKMVGRSITLKIMKRDPTAPVEPPKFLGHGACELFNKQMPLAAPGGKGTSNDKVIAEHAWRMLKGFRFDPRELRGIGIQVQKLEAASGVPVTKGQGRLTFQAIPKTRIPKPPPKIIVSMHDVPMAGPSSRPIPAPLPASARDADDKKDENFVDLPSFSQLDTKVFYALPPQLRQEIVNEYRQITPYEIQELPRRYSKAKRLYAKPPPAGMFPDTKPTNFKKVAQALAPQNKWSISPKKHTWLSTGYKRRGVSSTRLTDEEIQKMGFDPEVFQYLPRNIRNEQLARLRMIKNMGGVPEVSGKKQDLRFKKLKITGPIFRRPKPKAKFLQPAILRQQGKGEKLYFTEVQDVLNLIGKWVKRHRKVKPNSKDVEFFGKYLCQSVDSKQCSDEGIATTVKVMRWWMLLLRKHFDMYEVRDNVLDDYDDTPDRVVGEAWWKAFRDVKSSLDMIVRRKFGGKLSLS